MMSIIKDSGKVIDWNALDMCWAQRYEEEYGHYFSDLSHINTTIHLPHLPAVEASTDSYI